MNQQPWDADGGAREALSSAVGNYGPRVLSDARILGNMVTDLLPDSPRERSLLVAAAETDVAALLRQHIDEQRIDPVTAIRLAAGTLSDQKSIEPAACLWVTAEYARALGYQVPDSVLEAPSPDVRPGPGPGGLGSGGPGPGGPGPSGGTPSGPGNAGPTPSGPTPPPAGPSPTIRQQPGVRLPGNVHDNQTKVAPNQTTPGAPVWSNAPWPSGGNLPQAPAGPPQPPTTWQGSWPPPQGGNWSSGSLPQPAFQPTPPRRSGGGRRAAIAVTAVVALAGIYLAIAAAGKIAPFQKSAAASTTTTTTHTPTTQPPTSTTTTAPVSNVKLTKVLTNTGHVDNPLTQCQAATLPTGLVLPGMSEALTCSSTGLPGGSVYAYQMDNSTDYQTAWKNYNQWWLFDQSTAETGCPPTGSKTAHASDPWYSDTYPQKTGQVIECEWVGTGSNIPAYTWTVPSANAIIVADGATNSTFAALNSWWSGTPGSSSS